MEEIIEAPPTPEGDMMIYKAIVDRAVQLKEHSFEELVINYAAVEMMLWNLIYQSNNEEENKEFAEEVEQTLKKHVIGASALLSELATNNETPDPNPSV